MPGRQPVVICPRFPAAGRCRLGPDVTAGWGLRPAVTRAHAPSIQRVEGAAPRDSLRLDPNRSMVVARGTAIMDGKATQLVAGPRSKRMAAAVVSPLPTFLRAETAGGILLVAAAATALVWSNGRDVPLRDTPSSLVLSTS
jgi:hypothetical protein